MSGEGTWLQCYSHSVGNTVTTNNNIPEINLIIFQKIIIDNLVMFVKVSSPFLTPRYLTLRFELLPK